MHLLNRREAQGRLKVGQPIAIIDIGSNSVRLVAYEGLVRSLTPIYNEKVLCGLGRHVARRRQRALFAHSPAFACSARP